MSENPGLKNQIVLNALNFINKFDTKLSNINAAVGIIGSCAGSAIAPPTHTFAGIIIGGVIGFMAGIGYGKGLKRLQKDKIDNAIKNIEDEIVSGSIRVEGVAEGENFSKALKRNGFHWRFYDNETQGFQKYNPSLILDTGKMRALTSLSQKYSPKA